MKVEIKDKYVHAYIDWHELVNKYKDIFVKDKSFEYGRYASKWVKDLKNGNDPRFYGSDAKEMIERINKGYSFPDVHINTLPIVSYDRPRPRYTDDAEGEFDWDMFANGEVDCFLSKPKKESMGGIRMKVQIGFVARVQDRTITQYFKWVGQTLQAIQARGYDLELSIFNRNDTLYPQYHGSYQNIRISKFGEKIITKDWSALFSPGGHRHFMFMFYMWAAEQEKLSYAHHLGGSRGKGWKLEWEPDQRQLTIHVDSAAREFPSEQLTRELGEWDDK